MEPRIPSGKRFVGLLFLFFAIAGIAFSQSSSPVQCTASAVPTLVRSEGLTEQLGDVLLQCSGPAGAVVAANLNLLLPVQVTNRIDANSFAPDVSLAVDTGTGFVPSGISGQISSQGIVFRGLSLTLPASGGLTLRIRNLRADVNQLGTQASTPIQVFLSMEGQGGPALQNNPVTAAQPYPGLLASAANTAIRCTGSTLPAEVTVSNLFAAGSRFASVRVTEGFASAFTPKDATSDNGTRILIRYSGFPAGARLFVPDVVAGSTAAEPTAAGDLGLAPSGGKYTPGSGSLLLVRVLFADASGAGGTLVYNPTIAASGAVSFNAASEVGLQSGSGSAVYEIVDANNLVRESAQIPTFIGLETPQTQTVASEQVSFAPVSNVLTASQAAPVPRFAPAEPQPDCPALGDCDSGAFPQLTVVAKPIQFTATQGGAAYLMPGYIAVQNKRGGVLNWTATVTYESGSGWLRLENPSGLNNGSIRVWPQPSHLPPGTYKATVLIDAGPLAGTQAVPVALTVSAAPVVPPVQPSINIDTVTSAATLTPGPLAAGMLATIKGSNLNGNSVAVTFDGLPARLLYTGANQINLQIPAELAGKDSALLVVTVDGNASAPQSVPLAAMAPGIFPSGILNQDNSINGSSAPALAGEVIQIFATGLPDQGGGITVKVHDRDGLAPFYAGAAPGLPGVQQVNVAVPGDLPAMTTDVVVCADGPAGRLGSQRYCSAPVKITLGR